MTEVVDDALKEILGKDATEVICDCLEHEFSLRLAEIPRKPEVFSTVLKELIGSRAPILEKAIVENLHSKLQLEREEKEDLTFSDHVKFILSHRARDMPRNKLARKVVTNES